jgi:glycine/D-amino acid oxidase-like deaminating enzyme/nitrite reductase/ring-hydroxylating ferredoxin subunit
MNTPYWLATADLPHADKLKKNVSVDVVVVGGGITGITAAYLIKRCGLKVALLERDAFASADTAHTTAHLTCVTDLPLPQLVQNFGRNHAQAAWDAGLAAIEVIEHNVQHEKIDCDFQRVPGYRHAPLQPATDETDPHAAFQEEARLAADLGFHAAYMPSVPLVHRPGVRFPNQAKFHPLKYLAALLEKIPGNGSHIFEHTEAEEFFEKPLSVKAHGHTITCKYIVIATHVPLVGKNGLVNAMFFQTKIAPYSSYAIGAKLPPGPLPEACFWDTSDPYYYLRIDRRPAGNYAIFGGQDHKTGQTVDTEPLYQKLQTTLLALLPQAQIDHRWSGQVIESNDGLPLLGELSEKQFIATGFSGNGMTFGTLAAMMACDAALGRKNPWAELFNPHRTNILAGAWDYIKENLDYPFYLLKGLLASPEGTSLTSLKNNEGKIIDLHGQRLAAFRDAQGKVTTLSAVCTHLGCIVNWNTAEKTWDCPCHGSRFKCTGEVLAGPTETPLEKIPAP